MPASKPFAWPSGKRAALSISFDDARPSQVTHGVPILNRYGVRATFYVTIRNIEPQRENWLRAKAAGHEIANHTISHPCSGNFEFSRENALEDYTLDRMESELTGANEQLSNLFGSAPTSFAYPCGQTYVGRGERLQSYVPLVARHFTVGRLFRSERANDPGFCDLAQIFGWDFDNQPVDLVKEMIDRAVSTGYWLVFAAHGVGDHPVQAVTSELLDEVCRYATDPSRDIWVDTVAAIGAYVKSNR